MSIIVSLLIFTFKIFIHFTVEQSCETREWVDYKYKYNLEFLTDEDVYRREIFMENCQFIIDSNSRNLNFTLKMNNFGHLKKNEIPLLLNLIKPVGFYEDEDPILVGEEIPFEYDWRREGVVSPVMNQQECGSCYAFSAIGAIESQFAIHGGQLTNLSVQEIVDCSVSYGNDACEGGYMEKVYEYVMKNGISTYSAYPYTARHEHCERQNSNNSYKLFGYRGLKGGDKDNLLRALFYIGPISIAMNAAFQEFFYYESGIIDVPYCDPELFTHAVLAVGYNLNETPYLLVKNSWGTNWGIDGYFKIALDKNNICGILSWATFPIIDLNTRA